MNKKIITLIIVISLIAFIITTAIIIKLTKRNDDKEKTKNIEISKDIEDECTEEYEKEQRAQQVVSVEEKVAANAQLILKKYYSQCDHTINEYAELPQEIVNMTKEEVEKQYPEWQVIGFSPQKIILYKEYNDLCGEHFKLKIEDGKINIYLIDKDNNEVLYEKTNISSEYLTETDLLNMQGEGLEVYGKEELNKMVEDFE